jgi:hypothetical protein
MHFFAIVVLSALSVSAFPRGNTDNSVIARSASPEDIADAIAESAALLAADKISYDNNPGKTVQCPKTDRYDPHDFTANQIKVAYIGCAKLLAEHKQIGDSITHLPYLTRVDSNRANPDQTTIHIYTKAVNSFPLIVAPTLQNFPLCLTTKSTRVRR